LGTQYQWKNRLPAFLGIVDGIAVLLSLLAAQLGRFGTNSKPELTTENFEANYWLIAALIAIFWWITLHAWGARDVKILGAGGEEFKRVTLATLYIFGAVAIVSYAFRLDTARGFVGIALPVGLILLWLLRWAYRVWIVNQRKHGKLIRRLLLIGSPGAVELLNKSFESTPEAGYVATAAVVPGYSLEAATKVELNIPIVSVESRLDELIKTIEDLHVDAIALSSGSNLHPQLIQQLGWELHERNVSMIMAAALTDVAGPRIHMQPIAGLPLIHVSTPKLVGIQSFLKRCFDILGAVLGLTVLSPLFLILIIAIRLDSAGPAFFHQQRVGLRGEKFMMHKFRSMTVDAESRLVELKELNEGNSVLFKMKNDPRITKIGAFIRRYSIDELPQLWNVLVGDMSMVGPRPPLESEVENYEKYTARRLLVKPGVTGLWQVSGRSDLDWDESIRLDLSYVENWSLIHDFVILARTAKAVLRSDGAY